MVQTATGCGDSKAAQYRAEADDYAARKKNGFKDPQLEKWRKDGIKQKKKLKHVEDPLKNKRLPHNPKPKRGGNGPTLTGATPASGPSGDELKKQRGKLKHRR